MVKKLRPHPHPICTQLPPKAKKRLPMLVNPLILFGTPGWIRTSGFQLRRLTLYPLSYGRIFHFRVKLSNLTCQACILVIFIPPACFVTRGFVRNSKHAKMIFFLLPLSVSHFFERFFGLTDHIKRSCYTNGILRSR